MAVVPARTFERWLRALDGDAFAGFVADLYASRGRAVAVRADGAVVLTEEGRVLAPVAGGWRLRRPDVPADADAVVAADPSSRLRRLVARRNLSLVGPEDLRNLALYGIDRRDTERLFEEYFDASPVVAASDPDDSPRGGAVDGLGDVSAASVAAAVLAVLVVAAVFGPFGQGVAPASDDAARAESGPLVVGSVPPEDPDDDELFPPGLGPTGVVDVSALADAHAETVAGRSYRLVVRQSGTRRWDGRRWRGVWNHAEVENPRHFHYTATGYVENRTADASGATNATEGASADDGDELVQYAAYADGELVYVMNELRDETFYRYPVSIDGDGHGVFERRASFAIERYLNAPRTTVTRERNARYFDVVATGTPENVPDSDRISDYRAEALVGSNGFVSRLIVSYELAVGNETREVSYRMEYAAVDEVDVSRPVWYDRAVAATEPGGPVANGTAGSYGTATENGTVGNATVTGTAEPQSETTATDGGTSTDDGTSAGTETPAERRRAPVVGDDVRRRAGTQGVDDGA